MGSGVTVAHRFGAHEDKALGRAVHTSFVVGTAVGILISIIGFVFCPVFLRWMGTQDVYFDLAVKYMRIIFLGTPASILYNFGSAVMRSVGNSRTPLTILGLSGLLNVSFNVLFVLAFGMDVDGVAYGTIISQYVSCFSVWFILSRREDSVRFRFRDLCVDKRALVDAVRIGLPSGFQASLFAISNVLLASTVNGYFPDTTVEGNAVSSSIGSYSAAASTGIYQATLTFTGQNVGAQKPDRVKRVLFAGVILAVAVVGFTGWGSYLFSDGLAALFIDASRENAPAVMQTVKERSSLVLNFYFVAAVMEVLTGHLRGRKCSVTPMVTTLIFTCFFRIVWMLFIFPHMPTTIFSLYLCYPISWSATLCAHVITSAWLTHHEKKTATPANREERASA
jgi:putative MATE family efflux protein